MMVESVGGIKYLENKYLQVIMITKYLRPATWTLNYLQVITWKIWKGQVLAITCNYLLYIYYIAKQGVAGIPSGYKSK